MNPAHLPTAVLLIGLPVYWLELFLFKHPTGNTTWLAPLLALGMALWAAKDFWTQRRLKRTQAPALGYILYAAIFLAAVIIAVAFYAALFPPHLPQEFDVINYHITLPRQHLMANSFAHLPWSVADLYFAPLDYALAPYWLATALPNKFPQFLFFAGLLAVGARLAKAFIPGDRLAPWLVAVALAGTHVIGIQAGTAMLDLPACYLFFAAVDSLLNRRPILASIEFAFFAWSKSFMPLFTLTALVIVLALKWLCRRGIKGSQWQWAFLPQPQGPVDYKKFFMGFLISSAVIAGPFMARSIHYAGTPFYPVACGVMDAGLKDSPLCTMAGHVMGIKDAYGDGRGALAFIRHLWLVAVPEKGVNNRFDYPLGLTYLIVLGPFVFLCVRSLRQKSFPVLPVFCLIYWALWWSLGSQQSRFLFVPLAGMIVCAIPALVFHRCAAGTLKTVLLLAVALTAMSVVRAHKADWGKSAYEVLRPEDKDILRLAAAVKPGETAVLGRFDNAFAPFPFDVKGVRSEFIVPDRR